MDEYCFKQAPWARAKTSVYVDDQRNAILRIKTAIRDPIPYRNEAQKVMFAVGVEKEVEAHLVKTVGISPNNIRVAVGDYTVDIFITISIQSEISGRIDLLKQYLDAIVTSKNLAKLIEEAWTKSLHVLALQTEDDDVRISLG